MFTDYEQLNNTTIAAPDQHLLPEVSEFINFDLDTIVTPIKVDTYGSLLKHYGYDSCKTAQLIEGFSNSFDIGYRGPLNRREVAANLPFHVGDKYDLWEKLMKEVKLG